MSADNTNLKHVSLSELEDGMTIVSFDGFHSKYHEIDQKVCDWIKLNFKDSKAKVNRFASELTFGIEDLSAGDHLVQLFDFPPSRAKITKVNPRLVEELQKRGFKEFTVKKVPKTLTPKQEKRIVDVNQASEWVEKVKESEKVHTAATEGIENFFDNSRKNKGNRAEMDSFSELITKNEIAENMSALMSLKEHDHVYAHCVDVGVIFQSYYFKLIEFMGVKSPFNNAQQALIGATLHDLGKSVIPKELLSSNARFEQDSKEMKLIQSHPTQGAKLLSDMDFAEPILNMANFHHVKLDSNLNSSYPKDNQYSEVTLEGRLLAIIDVYQALAGKRPYKQSWSPPAAIRYLDALAGLEFDADLWDKFLHVFGEYPKGSLVELSDGSLAFVMSVSETDLERPKVVVVRNKDGEDLQHSTLVDLQEEMDLSIVSDKDSIQVFGKDAFQRFVNLKIT